MDVRADGHTRITSTEHLRDLVLDVTARLAAADDARIDRVVEQSLEMVARTTGIERTRVFEVSEDGATFSCTHEWTDPAMNLPPDVIQELPAERMAPWWQALERGEPVPIERVEAFPDATYMLRTMLEAQGVRSVLWIPMPGPGPGLTGFIGFASMGSERSWAQEEIHLLRATTNVIRGALARKRSIAQRDAGRARLEREVTFRRALIDLTNELVRTDPDARAVGELFERALRLMPAAQSGSVLLRDRFGGASARASLGYDLAELQRVRWPAAAISPARHAQATRSDPATLATRWGAARWEAWTRAREGPEPAAVWIAPIDVEGTLRGALVLDVAEARKNDVLHDPAETGSFAEAVAAQIASAIRRWDLETALRQERRQLAYLAAHDPLTGLANRRALKERLDQMLAHAHRHGGGVGLVFVDLDDFKHINDTLGHEAGDDLLRKVGERLRAAFRAEDTIARLGGDEFAVVVSDLVGDDALPRARDKLRSELAPAFVLHGRRIHVTASLGTAAYPNDGSDSDTLLRTADRAMYRHKRTR